MKPKKIERAKYFLDLSKILFGGGVLSLVVKNDVFELNQAFSLLVVPF